MKTSNLKKNAIAAVIAFISTITATTASATVIYEFSNTASAVYSGSALGATIGIFATATFTDISPGTVQLTLRSLENLPSSNYVDNWTFNLVSGPTIASISSVSGANGTASSTAVPITSIKNDVANGTNGGLFDLGFSFASLNPNALKAGGAATYNLTGSNLDASDFLASDNLQIYAAVHVNGGSTNSYFKTLNTTGVASAAVPEPTTVALLGLGLLGFAASRRKSAKA